MTRPDPRWLAMARLCENLATMTPLVDARLQANQRAVDGYPTRTPGAAPPTANPRPKPVPEAEQGVTLTPAEAAAEARLHWHRITVDRNAARNLIAVTLHDLITDGQKLLRDAPLPGVELCRCTGREGAAIPRADGGWSDPACRMPADKAGLCQACYTRERRWRIAHGLRARGDAA